MSIYSRKNPPFGFYVYAYLRKDGSPYYIGKGKGHRAWIKMKCEPISAPNNNERIVILESNLTELGALAVERRMIRWYGRKDLNKGILRNKTDGGEGASGCIRSEETRKRMSDAKKGIPSPLKGKPKSPSHAAKLAESNRARKGKKNPAISAGKTGKPSKLKGKKRPELSAKKLGVPRGPQRTVICTHCGKEGGVTNMNRYHFDNCKFKILL